MVLKVQIGGYDVRRIFIDARSGINLIYARTLKTMNISLGWLQPNHPLGKIELNVCFGDGGNF
jgi:hypothetical protein